MMAVPIRVSSANRERVERRSGMTTLWIDGDGWLFFDLSQPQRTGITLGYIKYLAESGHVGLERIPRECVIRR